MDGWMDGWMEYGCKFLLRYIFPIIRTVSAEVTYFCGYSSDNREYIKEWYDSKREAKHLNPAQCLEARTKLACINRLIVCTQINIWVEF